MHSKQWQFRKYVIQKKSKNGYQDIELRVEMVFFWGNWLIYDDGNSFKKEKKYLQIVQVLPVFVTVSTFTSNKPKKFKYEKKSCSQGDGYP